MSNSRASPTLILTFLSLSFMLSYFDRMLMVVLGETVKGEFQLSDKQLSILTGAAFVFLYGICGVLAGWLMDRMNRKRLLVFALGLWSAATMVCGLANSYLQLALARAAVGVGEAATTPASLSMIADMYPPARRPMASAVFYAGGMIGVLASFGFGTWVAHEYGWRAAFFAAGPPGFLLALAMIFFTHDPARERTAHAGGQRARGGFRDVYANKALIWTIVAGSIATYSTVGMMSWLPMFFMRSLAMSPAQMGLYFGPVLAIGMTSGMLLGGWLGNAAARRSVASLSRVCAMTVGTSMPLFLLMLWAPTLPAALALLFVAMTCSSLFSPIYSAAWQTICAPEARGTAAGITGFAATLVGGAICPFIVGMLSDAGAGTFHQHSLRYALAASMVFLVAAVLVFLYSARLVDRSPALRT